MKGGSCGTSFCPMAPPQMGGQRSTKKRSQYRGGNYLMIKTLPTMMPTGNTSATPAVMSKNTGVTGGYRVTVRDKKYLAKWKRGKPIGFTMRSSLKAKGLIPRANGKKRISVKYRAF